MKRRGRSRLYAAGRLAAFVNARSIRANVRAGHVQAVFEPADRFHSHPSQAGEMHWVIPAALRRASILLASEIRT